MELREIVQNFTKAQKKKDFYQMDSVAALSIEQLSRALRMLKDVQIALNGMIAGDIYTPEYFIDQFDVCPECGETDGFLHVGREEWFVCHKHKTKWCVGSNLFSGWREMTDEEFQKNAELLEGYKEVKPIHRLLESRASQDSDDISF